MIAPRDAQKNFSCRLRAMFGSRLHDQDASYLDLLERAKGALDEYAANPLSEALLHKCDDIVLELENLSRDRMTASLHARSLTNVASIAALTRRTHYAAYIAGQWSTSKDLGAAFKAWMHNAAAHGAICLSEAIGQYTRATRPDSASEAMVLSAFAEGAVYDARRFIRLADGFFDSCAVSRYNEAKLDILSGSAHLLRPALSMLKAIAAPKEDCHPAEVLWHQDNHKSFVGADQRLRERIGVESASDLAVVQGILERNANEARAIAARRGESSMWKDETRVTKAIMTGAMTGVTLLLAAGCFQFDLGDLKDLIVAHSDVLSSQVASLSQGTGGLYDSIEPFVRTFGTGGL